MICRTDISNLKTDINDKIGQKIIVKGSLGRSKEFAKEGTIEKAYSNLFVVKYEENDNKWGLYLCERKQWKDFLCSAYKL